MIDWKPISDYSRFDNPTHNGDLLLWGTLPNDSLRTVAVGHFTPDHKWRVSTGTDHLGCEFQPSHFAWNGANLGPR